MTEARGIYQSDLIIVTAIREAFRDLRANPWLLDYMFQSLRDDPLTVAEYGEKQIDAAKRWLLKTEIPVFVNQRLDAIRLPAITVNLVESAEVDNTAGDVHYIPREPIEEPWPALAGPFVPARWTASAGELVLPKSVTDTVDVFPGMNIVDRAGNLHPILEVSYDSSERLVAILDVTVNTDFSEICLKSGSPPALLELESAWFRESYLLGTHISGEAWQLTVLHSALVFCLLRYRQDLLEARGFEISSISSTDFSRNQSVDPEIAYSRYVNLSGKVRQVWPKRRVSTVQGARLGLKVIGAEHLPAEADPNEALWIGELDDLGDG